MARLWKPPGHRYMPPMVRPNLALRSLNIWSAKGWPSCPAMRAQSSAAIMLAADAIQQDRSVLGILPFTSGLSASRGMPSSLTCARPGDVATRTKMRVRRHLRREESERGAGDVEFFILASFPACHQADTRGFAMCGGEQPFYWPANS